MPAVATHRHRHHCLAALRVDKPGTHNCDSPKRNPDVQTLFDAAFRQQLQGSPCAAFLDAPYKAIEIDILRGESRTPDFLAKNPSGQVPLLEVAAGRYLAESNAILWYVAGGTSLAPESRIERAEALQWMFFEQHALEPNIGAAYFWLSLVKGGRDLQTHALEDWMERGYGALQVMENHLKTHEFFAAGQLTVADIALYGYTHVADQCDFDLAAFPAIGGWLRRVERMPGFVTMDWRPDLEAAYSASIAADA
jgi:glutathione S-transferase